MMKIDWTTYIEDQLLWAERLMEIAEDAEGDERKELYQKGQAALYEASRKLGELLSPILRK